MIVQLQDVIVIQLIHDFDLQFDLLYEIVLEYLLLVNYLDGKYILGNLVPNFVDLSKPTYSNVRIR